MAAPLGRALSVLASGQGQRAATRVGAALLLAGCALVPLLALLEHALAPPTLAVGAATPAPGAPSPAGAAFAATLGDPATWRLLAGSLGLAAATTCCALALGVPMGLALGATDLRGRHLAWLVHSAPLLLPPLVPALGWVELLGGRAAVEPGSLAEHLYGPWGLTLLMAAVLAPLVSALVGRSVAAVEPSLREAALVASSRWRALLGVVLPLAWPSIALGALLVFALTLSEVGVAMLLRVRTYPSAVFARLAGLAYAPGEATLLVAPLVAVGLGLWAAEARALRRRPIIVGLGPRSHRALPVALGHARGALGVAVWLAAALSALPLVALLRRSGLHGLRSAAASLGTSLLTSLGTSAAAATLIVLLGAVLGHALARMPPGSPTLPPGPRSPTEWLAGAADALALLWFLTPAAVLGVGLTAAWNRPHTQALYGSAALIVVALVARYSIVGTRMLTAALRAGGEHHEAAAACAGAGYWRRLALIVLPMHGRELLGCWLVAFVFAMRDLDTVMGCYPPGLEPLPVRIFTLEANGSAELVAGLCVWQMLATAAVLGLGGVLLTRGGSAP